jgi:hypothetical protein
MFSGVSSISFDRQVRYVGGFKLCFTLVTELTAPKNRPLVPCPSTTGWPSKDSLPEYSY